MYKLDQDYLTGRRGFVAARIPARCADRIARLRRHSTRAGARERALSATIIISTRPTLPITLVFVLRYTSARLHCPLAPYWSPHRCHPLSSTVSSFLITTYTRSVASPAAPPPTPHGSTVKGLLFDFRPFTSSYTAKMHGDVRFTLLISVLLGFASLGNSFYIPGMIVPSISSIGQVESTDNGDRILNQKLPRWRYITFVLEQDILGPDSATVCLFGTPLRVPSKWPETTEWLDQRNEFVSQPRPGPERGSYNGVRLRAGHGRGSGDSIPL